MNGVLKVIKDRRSERTPFDPRRPVSRGDLENIVEAARWAPTPHNMQNFDVIVVDDRALLKRIGEIKSPVSMTFVRENYPQLSFSREELLKRKTGILGTWFPPAWRDPARFNEVPADGGRSTLEDTIDGSPTILVVAYDPGRRAPASEGDFLGILGLGCVMENMWLEARSLNVGLQVMSVFGDRKIQGEVKRVLRIPSHMRIAYALRLGFPARRRGRYLRVRRDASGIVHHNMYGNRGLA